ncbi:MAG: ABC transporter permease subunit [Bdellovibrionales bacterium]|nr:ABC transporter permease subunit [Bdellovibrionales bacterium]
MIARITTLALNTYRESIRSKVLYSLGFIAMIVVGASALFRTVTIGDQVKVIKDFGLFTISLFSVAYAVISGSSLLNKELSRRTIFTILSRPVRRWEFLVGKLLGLFVTTSTLVVLLAIAFTCFLALFEQGVQWGLLQAYLHILIELFIVCSSVIFFSSIVVTPMLIGLFTFGLFLAGRSLDFLLYFINEGLVSGVSSVIIRCIYWSLPHLNSILINDAVVYGHEVPLFRTFWASVYALTYGFILVAIGYLLFQRREFH